jgi:plastocyanin
MHKTSTRSNLFISISVVVLVLGLGVGVIACTGQNSTPGNHTSSSPPPAIVNIPRGQETFEPFILTVKTGTTVTWQNQDTAAHTIMTTPDQNNFLNLQALLLHVGAGQHVQFTFTVPGLYHYYDNTMAQWDTANDRVSAKKGAPHFPLAMDGIIWVQGPLSNLPSGSSNRIPNGHDDFANEFLAINQGGTVLIHNFDTDTHLVAGVPGWSGAINPTSIGINEVAGTDNVPGGDTVTLTFTTPGLYYYYCPNHAQVDTTTHRAIAMQSASEFPVPMEGFVLVVGR